VQIMASKSKIVFVISASVILSFVTFYLVLENASEEPFLRFSARFAYTQLIVSSVIIVLWVEMLLFSLFHFIRKRSRVLFAVITCWCLFALYWQIQVPQMYISDVVKFAERWPK
jgi:hypothetical protein